MFCSDGFLAIAGSPYGKYIQCISGGTAGNVYLSVSDATFFYSSNNGELWTLTDYNHSFNPGYCYRQRWKNLCGF